MRSMVRGLAATLVAAGLLATGCGAGTDDDGAHNREDPAAAESAPIADALRFTATTVDGQEFSGESLAGKPAVLWFWAADCPDCKLESAGVANVAKENADTVSFVGVGALTNVPDMRKFVQDNGISSFTNIADTESVIWQQFGVTAQPAYAFVSASGNVETVKGTLSEEELASRVDQLDTA